LHNSTTLRRLIEAKALPQKQFIFGYSTGHVGTTTFANEEAYCSKKECSRKKRILFKHEHHSLKRDEWKDFDLKQEYNWVNKNYFPHILNLMSEWDKDIYFDTGHTSLYYADGLMKYINENNLYHTTTFLRIRRHRHEAAVSLTFNREEMSQNGIKKDNYMDEAYPVDPTVYAKCSFNPFYRPDDVIIKIKPDIWETLTPFQKGLWVVDETEEQWLRLIKKYPSIKYVEIYFESEKGLSDNTMTKAMKQVADVLGIEPATHEVHSNVHVPDTMAQKLEKTNHRKKMKEEDEYYRKAFNYFPNWSYLPPTYNTFEDPPG
jgi:hypothetical protein